MAILFKSINSDTYIECEVNFHHPKTIDIIITDDFGVEKCVFLDLNTAIRLRKHLGCEIGKLRNQDQ